MSGFGNVFKQVVNSMDGKALDAKVIAGSSKYMGEGDFDIRVVAIDTNKLGKNELVFKYENAAGKEHNDLVYVTDVNKKTGVPEMGWKFAKILGMLIPSIEAYDAFMGEVAADNVRVLDCLVGLKGHVTLARTKGYSYANAQPDGSYVVHNVARPDETYVGRTIDEAKAAAEKAGLKTAYANVTVYKATHGAENIAKFTAALVALRNPQQPQQQQQAYRPRLATGGGSI